VRGIDLKQLMHLAWMLATFGVLIYSSRVAYTLRRVYSRVPAMLVIAYVFVSVAFEVAWADARHFTFSAADLPTGFYVMGLVGRVPELAVFIWADSRLLPSNGGRAEG
jgi:hypothetical protein